MDVRGFVKANRGKRHGMSHAQLRGELPRRIRARVALGWLTASAIFACFAVPARAQLACDQSTQNATRGCVQKADSDFWFALGMCGNLHPAAVSACQQKARDTRTAAKKLCRSQAAARGSICQLIGEAPYDPQINPADFSPQITNPLLPLRPGTVFTYTVPNGLTVIEVTRETHTIMGVPCVVVHDTVTVAGVVEEDKFDYFTQDRFGDVWYFGEATEQFSNKGQITGLVGS